MKIAPWVSSLNGVLYHWCPACEKLHVIPQDGWICTGSDTTPSYTPSFDQLNAMGPGKNCHYVIINGSIQFYPDSWHRRTDLVPLPDIPDHALEKLNDGLIAVNTDAVFR